LRQLYFARLELRRLSYSGEGGIRPIHRPQVTIKSGHATKALILKRVPFLPMFVVLCGWLASVGNVFSTLPAHSFRPDAALPAPVLTRLRGRCRRDDAADSSGRGAIAASYARYSSDMQDASSIEQQQRKCREQAERNGHAIQSAFEFKDHAVSGTRVDRNGFQAMLKAAREKQFEVLYFESLSRLAREFIISMPVLKELVSVHKVRVISTSEGIDSINAGWEFMALIRSWMHGEFLTALRSAVLRGQESAVLGDYSVGDWCLGYASEPIPGSETGRRGRNSKTRMRVIINESHAAWVRNIFHWFVVDRQPLVWIVRELTRLDAPKDHRATTKPWRQSYVVRVLRNRKYIGIWPWGLKTNVRNPLTGRVHQEDRPPEEAAQYERERPLLRIVEDEPFFRAQSLLDENEAKVAANRKSSGRLCGSTKDLARPCHLLQGVVRCGVCRAGFKVAGAYGTYLECGGYRTGQCRVKTRLRRERAERLILDTLGKSILRNPRWHQMVLNTAQAAWTERHATCPDETKEVEQALVGIEQKISRLLDTIEAGETGQDVRDRLAGRQRERSELERRRQSLQSLEKQEPTTPTAEWVTDRIRQLQEVVTSEIPAAGVALRNLVGQIVVVEIEAEQRKRKYLRGTFTICTAAVLNPVGTKDPPADTPRVGELVTLDFIDPLPWCGVADKVKELYDTGVRFEDMADQLGCPRSWPAKALAHWHTERGLPPPDGRKTRDRLADDPKFAELANRAKELWDQGVLMQEIATELRCCRDTVTAAIKYWYVLRNIPVPDGRARRKELPRKSSPPASDTPPS